MTSNRDINAPSAGRMIDPKPLQHSTLPDYCILLISTLLGVLWGSILLFIACAITIIGLPFAIAMLGTLVLMGCILVPFGATVAGFLNLHYSARWAKAVFKLAEPSPDDPLGARVLELSRRLGLSRPPAALWMDEVNAFAMGSGAANGVVAIGRPLTGFMTSEELDAIIGHELGHVVSNDMRRTVFSRAYQEWLSWFLLWRGLQSFVRWFMTPIGEMLLMAQSRRREYWADAVGAALTSKEAMISALEKIHAAPAKPSRAERRYAAFMCKGFKGGLFRTHPTLEQRINALQRETHLSRIRFRPSQTERLTPVLPANSATTYADGL